FAPTLLSLATLENVITGYTVLQAPLSFRENDIPLWHPEPASLPLMRRLKESLDPKSVLNPGRFVGRI
ncbi:MAG: FAD-binding oxidoreductase, partial [Cytophagaceae bacterium]